MTRTVIPDPRELVNDVPDGAANCDFPLALCKGCFFIESLHITSANQLEMFCGNTRGWPLSSRYRKFTSFLQDLFYINEGFKCLLPRIILQVGSMQTVEDSNTDSPLNAAARTFSPQPIHG